jgi:alkanesulfonate monooxygenase SsuD/methylene tetrahydromethanopterin reductase-like flavin-dependent oxidoreductase (luciferase family)
MGCGFSFAQFISGEDPAAQVRQYRERFRPSPWRAAPAASVALGVICAPTQDEARHLAASLELWRRRIAHGRDRGIPSPEEALEEMGASYVPPRLGEDGARVIAGDPSQVRDELRRIATRCGADELMIVTVTHSWEARVRSYELIAEAVGLGG